MTVVPGGYAQLRAIYMSNRALVLITQALHEYVQTVPPYDDRDQVAEIRDVLERATRPFTPPPEPTAGSG